MAKDEAPLLLKYRHLHPRRLRPPEYWGVRQAYELAQRQRRAARRRAKVKERRDG